MSQFDSQNDSLDPDFVPMPKKVVRRGAGRAEKDPYYANIGMCGKCYAVCTYTQAYHNRLKKENQ